MLALRASFADHIPRARGRKAKVILSFLPVFGGSPLASPWDTEDPSARNCSASNAWSSMPKASAAAQPVSTNADSPPPFAARLKDNEAVLLGAYHAIANTVRRANPLRPPPNGCSTIIHIVEEQIREIRDRSAPGLLPPAAQAGRRALAGYPRVFGVAWAFVAHTDSRFDPDMLCRFVRAYQRVQPLTIGELWAVAITLRIVLVENLRRAAKRIVSSRDAREEADDPGRPASGRERPMPPSRPIWRLVAYEQPPLPEAFAVQLVQRLRDQDPQGRHRPSMAARSADGAGNERGRTVHDEHQRQGAASVTVRNIITSMRLVSDVDWTGVVRKRQPGRRRAASRQRFRCDGFSHARPLPQRHRSAGAGVGSDGIGNCARRASATAHATGARATRP